MNEPAAKTIPDTTRSWRVMRMVFTSICSLVTFGIIFSDVYKKATELPTDVSAGYYLLKGILLAILGGTAAWVGAWLLVVAIAFIWWFFLDRIREFFRAAKGRR